MKTIEKVKRFLIDFSQRSNQEKILFILSRILIKLKINKFIKIKRDGYQIIFSKNNIASEMFIKGKRFYRDEEIFIKSFLNTDSVFIDIGANIGTMSFAAKTIIKSGKVIAIEANPNTYKALLANNELNMNPLEVHNYALGESDGFLMISNLHADDCNSINGSVQSKETFKNYLKVKSTKLDFLLSELKKIDFIKIDVEGFELAVLKGALECIKKTHYIYLELGDRLNAKYGYKSLDVIKLLKSLNFKIRIIENFQQRDLPDEINFNNVHMFLAINKSLDG